MSFGFLITCIGCGCDDDNACEGIPCFWIRKDEDMGLGVCSSCPGEVARWDQGDFPMSRVARIGEDDDSELTLPGDEDFDETMELLD